MVKVLPPARVSEETVIVWLETESVPALAVEYPAFEPVVEGAFQPLGTTRVIAPLEIPPVAAVYVKVSVRPVCEALTADVGVVRVPDPSAALTVMLGDVMFCSVPVPRDICCACHV